jgi:aminopeptidase N
VASCNTRRTRWRIHGGGSGDANTWQDWLNESFAEYSAVLLMRDWHGRAVSGGILARYEREAQEAKPIWGFDRNDRSAQATLYRKGPVLLSRLESRMGEPAFRRLLAALVTRKVRTTEDFLATLQELTSADVRQSFEQELKG